MSQHRAQIVVLCEDRQQDVFVRKMIEHRKGKDFHRRQVTSRICPKGAGEAFVRTVFPQEVRTYRSKSFLNICLVVVIDADVSSVAHRIRQLESALGDQRLEPVRKGEKILILVPKRNIETWIRHFEGEMVDESISYKKRGNFMDCKPSARAMSLECRSGVPEAAPDSIKTGCKEMQRDAESLQSELTVKRFSYCS